MSEDAIGDAIAEATAEVEGTTVPEETAVPQKEEQPVETEQEAKSETKTEEAATATEEKPEEKTEETTEEENELNLSADDLKLINDDPKLLKAYKSMQRGLTQKTTGLADTRKQHEENTKMIEYIRANPDAAVEEMARTRGYIITKKSGEDAAKADVAEATSDTIDALMEKYSKDLGPESAKLLLPMMKEVAQTIATQAINPIAQQQQFLDRSAKERGISAAVHEFGAAVKEQGEDWSEDIQTQMSEMMDRVVPGEQTNIQDYLGTLYDAVTAKTARATAVKTQLTRLRKAKDEAEPTHAVRPAPKTAETITSDMSERDAIAMATRQAEEEVRVRAQ